MPPDSPNPSPTDQVMVLLPRDAMQGLVEAAGSSDKFLSAAPSIEDGREEWGEHETITALRSALSQEAGERQEHRIVAGPGDALEVLAGPVPTLPIDYERQALALWADEGKQNPRVQFRSIYSYGDGSQFLSVWRDLGEGE